MTQTSFRFKILFTFIFLSWFYLLVSSAAGAESVPFPKEPIATSTHRIDDKLSGVVGNGGVGNGDRYGDRDSYVLAFINFTYSASDGEEIRRSEEKARYGEGRILNVQGHLVHVTREHNVSDHTACTENIRGTNNKPLPPRGEPWIALVRRGSCTFEKKIRHVWLQGAAGVIVYNDEASVSLEKMKIIEKERNITAVFTFRWIGEEMARVADSNQKVWVSISEGTRGFRPTNINKTSVLFVSISFIILMVISLVWLIFYYIQRFRYLQSKDQNERNLCSAAKRIIMKIPTKSGKTEDKEAETDCCAICIENYKSTDCIRVLPCRHEFHKNCIDPWLLEHRTCPMCKLDILKHYGFVIIGSEESFLDLDLDAELGQGRLSRRRNSDISVSTNMSARIQTPILLNRASLTIGGSDDTQLLQVPGPRRVRSSSLQLLSPFCKRHEINKASHTFTSLSPDDIRNFDMDLNNIRTKPTHHRKLRSRSADTCRDSYNRRLSANLDYCKFKNEASTSGTSKSKQYCENIQMQTSRNCSSCELRRKSLIDQTENKEIVTPCNITIRIIDDDESASESDKRNSTDDSTSHL
ncbi:E3 ubiquitin-protein ligase goliath isoform X2 [Condylostylus longicornis]|uniref:E3 ubiquitin-protein ligase goliath isoform X2 n=1 Tax=Condylostylus longicornis TaxID=2530218 RepID=UPI00244E1F4E|nr:E3 ubiquitin-protein ligase goliath isoform X2 [Condylostylus longicornis]